MTTGYVQSFVTWSFDYAEPSLTSIRKDYKRVDEWCKYIEQRYSSDVRPVIKNIDDKIDTTYKRLPTRDEIKIKVTEAPKIINEKIEEQKAAGINKATGFYNEVNEQIEVQKTAVTEKAQSFYAQYLEKYVVAAEPFLQTQLDKILPKDENASLQDRVKKLPQALHILAMQYYYTAVNFAKKTIQNGQCEKRNWEPEEFKLQSKVWADEVPSD
eukprot:gene148-398_t